MIDTRHPVGRVAAALQQGPSVVLDPFNPLVRLLLEPACAACDVPLDRPLSGPVCGACWRAVPALTPPTCQRCGDALTTAWRTVFPLCARCRRQPPLVACARSAGQYDGSLRQIIHAFKYEHRRVLAAPLAGMMRAAGSVVLTDAEAVVPVPLHPWRSFSRGFNQADDLARHLGLPVWRVLRRRRHGPPQAGLPAARRHANVRGAFALRRVPLLASDARRVSAHRVQALVEGRTLVLVDDVMTTGATLDACARALLDAGARSVRALTAARAVAGRPAPPPRTRDPSAARRR